MEIRRTANAGVQLKLENATILLDGVCREVFPYLCTPSSLQSELLCDEPDVIAFTHHHKDHFDPEFARKYTQKYGRKAIGTAQMANLYPDLVSSDQSVLGDQWRLTAIQTRHLGKYGLTTEHISYMLEADRCIWFMGDASPIQAKLLLPLSKPDVLIVPYAYFMTPSAVQIVDDLQPNRVILLHMPLKEQDPDGLWQLAEPAFDRFGDRLTVPGMGQVVTV